MTELRELMIYGRAMVQQFEIGKYPRLRENEARVVQFRRLSKMTLSSLQATRVILSGFSPSNLLKPPSG
jgi:hypothetical protein